MTAARFPGARADYEVEFVHMNGEDVEIVASANEANTFAVYARPHEPDPSHARLAHWLADFVSCSDALQFAHMKSLYEITAVKG